jgi:hypothetical protein
MQPTICPFLTHWSSAYRLLGRTLVKMHWHPRRLEETDCVEDGREDDSHNEMLVVVVLGIHRAHFLVGGSRSSSASSGEGGFGAVDFFMLQGESA